MKNKPYGLSYRPSKVDWIVKDAKLEKELMNQQPKPNEGDLNSDERGTCARFNGGKTMFSLVPMHLLYGAARVFMHGMQKYAPWNWAKGGKWSTAFDCLIRHLFKWWFCREELDKESGQHHLDHAICNLLFLRHYRDTYKDGDDRPPASAAFDISLLEMNKLYEPELPEPKKREEPEQNCENCAKFEPGCPIKEGCMIPVPCPHFEEYRPEAAIANDPFFEEKLENYHDDIE
jgi:hypothetical protein